MLRRSLTLWLGLIGLLFVIWAWVDSTRSYAEGSLHRVSAQHQDGALKLTYNYGPTRATGTHFVREAFPGGTPRWFAPFHWEYFTGHLISFVLPHWLILLAYAAVWAALLSWRRRRIRKAGPIMTA